MSTSAEESVYRDWCASDASTLAEQLVADMEECSLRDHRTFTRLISHIRTHYWDEFVLNAGNGGYANYVRLMRLVCTTVDARELRHLVGEVICGELDLMDERPAMAELLKESLKWTTVEQHFLWEMIRELVVWAGGWLRGFKFIKF